MPWMARAVSLQPAVVSRKVFTGKWFVVSISVLSSVLSFQIFKVRPIRYGRVHIEPGETWTTASGRTCGNCGTSCIYDSRGLALIDSTLGDKSWTRLGFESTAGIHVPFGIVQEVIEIQRAQKLYHLRVETEFRRQLDCQPPLQAFRLVAWPIGIQVHLHVDSHATREANERTFRGRLCRTSYAVIATVGGKDLPAPSHVEGGCLDAFLDVPFRRIEGERSLSVWCF